MVTSFTVPTLIGGSAEYQGGWREVAEGTWAWLQPNGRLGESNAGLVCGDGEALLVDTLWDPVITERMLESAPVPAETITVVVNTHGDGDHCWGNQVLEGRRIVAAQAAVADMTEFKPGPLVLGGLVGSLAVPVFDRIPFLSRVPGGKPTRVLMGFLRDFGRYDFRKVRLTPPTESFTGSVALEVGGRRVELVEVGPAHTRSDVLVHVPDVNVVFSGDILFAGVTPIMWAGPAERWIAALERILALDPRTVVPGHGPVSTTAEAIALKEYWEFVGREAAARHAAGQSALRAAREIVADDEFARRGYRDWHDPARLGVSLVTAFDHLSGRPESATRRPRALLTMARLGDAC